MTSKNHGTEVADSLEVIDMSTLEYVPSASEEEPTQRKINNRRLAQAINYLTEEGGDDSPATFMHRVDQIDEALLQQLPQQGRDFDTQLYRRAQAMVREIQLEFEEAAEEDSPSMLSGQSPILESVEELPEYYTPSAAQALYRKGETPDEPRSKPPSQRPAAKEEVRREHVFKYGGPNNEAESWHKNYPASLPFPETFQMAHWESLKIDFDLSESGKQQKADGKIVETNIPFDRPELEQYKNLPVYESGSRFKLPIPSASVKKAVNELGTPESLANSVQAFNSSNDKVRDGKYEYTPRVFLEKLTVGTEPDPTTIRRAMNTTPVRSRTGTICSGVQREPSNTNQKSTGTKPTTKQISKHRPLPTQGALENAMALVDEQTHLADGDTYATKDKARTAKSAARVANEKLRKAEDALSAVEQAKLTTSPVVRRINQERATSLERSPRRQSGISTASPSPATPTKTTTVHPKVVIEKQPRSRLPKSNAAALPTSQKLPEPIKAATPKSTTKKQTKRKRSLSEQNYTPESKRSKPIAPSSLKSTRTRAQTTPDQVVYSLSDESEEFIELSEDDVMDLEEVTAVVTSVNTKPAKKVVRTKAVTKKVTKAAAAGKAVRKVRVMEGVEEIVGQEDHAPRVAENRKAKSTETVVKGSTRSGARYLKE